MEREEDKVIIRVRGYLVDVFCRIDPNYKKFVTTNKKGEKQLVLLCENAIYGTLIASLLFYNKFVKTLKRNGFELNPYEPCLVNHMVDGKQQTCGFHVDDRFLAGQGAANDRFIETLREEYESVFEDGSGNLKVQRGKVLKYLGMTLDFTTAGQVKVSMFDYVDDLLRDYKKAAPEEHETKSSAAPRNVFVVGNDCEKLDKKKAEQFHHLVAKTLFVTKRARPDTGTAVSFISTRVRAPDKQDWTKLVHLMKFLRGTRKTASDFEFGWHGDPQVVGRWLLCCPSQHERPHWWWFDHGTWFSPLSSSTKQKLNTRSSTESEVVGVDDLLPAILWTRIFLQAQGYGVKECIVFQDNKSAILLEKNGKASSSKRTKHISIHYFFVTNRIKKGELSVEWCPTKDMLGDFWTKPTQGKQFTRVRD